MPPKSSQTFKPPGTTINSASYMMRIGTGVNLGQHEVDSNGMEISTCQNFTSHCLSAATLTTSHHFTKQPLTSNGSPSLPKNNDHMGSKFQTPCCCCRCSGSQEEMPNSGGSATGQGG